jgi:membrane protein YdbS with pleckstrin-like domain
MSVPPLPAHERVVWQGHPAWADHAVLFVLMAAAFLRSAIAYRSGEWVTAVLYLLAVAIFFSIAAVFRYATFYEITSGRIRVTSGLTHRRSREIMLDHIQSIGVRRELLNGLFDIGSLEIVARDGGPPLLLKGVPHPEEVKHLVGVRAGIRIEPAHTDTKT